MGNSLEALCAFGWVRFNQLSRCHHDKAIWQPRDFAFFTSLPNWELKESFGLTKFDFLNQF
jgi:hypothetical protein